MSTAQIWQTSSTSLNETLNLAQAVGHKLRGSEVIELVSDLGGGKTAFVRGLAKGLGSPTQVNSPSFTLSNQYQAGKLTLCHFDFHRLSEPGIMRDELAEILADPANIVAVEWAGIVEDVLPAKRLTLNLEVTGENSRKLTFNCPPQLAYLMPEETA